MIKYKDIEWINKQGALIPNVAPHTIMDLTESEQKELIKLSGAYFIRWNTSFDKEETDFWYVIKDSFGDLEELSSKMRNQVKKGIKHCYTKLINKELLINRGYVVYIEASKRYDTFENIMSIDEFEHYINKLDDEAYEFWGVFDRESDILIAYSQNYIFDKSCFYEEIFYHPEYLKNYSSYILFFNMNKYYLEENNFSYVHDGSRNLSHATAIHDFLINKFKFRKAYSKMEIAYRYDVKFAVKLLYPFKSLIYKSNTDIFQKISVLLKHEEIREKYE